MRERFLTIIYRSSISDLNAPEWVDVTPVPLEQETRGGRRVAADIKGNGYRGARGKGCSARTAGVCLSAGCSVAPRELAGRTPFPDRDRRSPPWSRRPPSAAFCLLPSVRCSPLAALRLPPSVCCPPSAALRLPLSVCRPLRLSTEVCRPTETRGG